VFLRLAYFAHAALEFMTSVTTSRAIYHGIREPTKSMLSARLSLQSKSRIGVESDNIPTLRQVDRVNSTSKELARVDWWRSTGTREEKSITKNDCGEKQRPTIERFGRGVPIRHWGGERNGVHHYSIIASSAMLRVMIESTAIV
jgi:hypothetical protein